MARTDAAELIKDRRQKFPATRNHIPDVQPDAQRNGLILRNSRIYLLQPVLDIEGSPQRIHSTAEFDEEAVASGIGDAAAILSGQRLNHPAANVPERGNRALFIPHQPGVPGQIGSQDRSQAAIWAVFS